MSDELKNCKNALEVQTLVMNGKADPMMAMARIMEIAAAEKQAAVAAAVKEAEAKSQKTLSCQISRKGCVSVYGLQQMPVSLYIEQWERLEKFLPQVFAFWKEVKAKPGEFERLQALAEAKGKEWDARKKAKGAE